MSLKNTIKNRHSKTKRFVWKGVEVVIKDDIKDPSISVRNVLQKIGLKIPNNFLINVDVIYVGQFDFLNKRSIQAVYENSCIFVTNDQSSIEDMCDDIVHEIAHSLEEIYKEMIYSDGKLEREFLIKRKQLYSILRDQGLEAELVKFLEPSYQQDFDQYLYMEIGYPTLDMLGSSIFYSPYAATSIREYFANGFEAFYYYGDFQFINKYCPELFQKLTNIMEIHR